VSSMGRIVPGGLEARQGAISFVFNY
jgi:hypothetical protein